MTTKINNEHKKVYVPNKREQNQTCLDSAEREVHSPKGNVPNLRFPEFQGEWEKCTFDKIAQYKKGPFGSALKKDIFVPQSEDTIKVYEQQNAIKKDWTLSRYYITKDYFNSHMKQFVAKAGDLIVSCAGTIGEIYELPQDAEEGVFNQALMRVQVNDEAVNKEIFITVFSSMIDKFSKIYSNGSAIKNIPPFADLKKTQIFLPCKEEQKKIAKLLALLDERIATQNKIIDKLQSLIKGISNKLLNSKEGMLVRLGAILKERSEKTKKNNQYAVLSSTVNGLFSQRDYFSKDIASENNVGYKIIRLHDVVLSPQNLWMGNINYNDKFDIGIVSPSYKVFLISDNYDKRYVAAMLKTHRALYDYQLISEQGASVVRRNLNLESFGQLVFRIPLIDKQREIGKTISLLKSRLETESMLRAAYQSQKQYLLRQMFI